MCPTYFSQPRTQGWIVSDKLPGPLSSLLGSTSLLQELRKLLLLALQIRIASNVLVVDEDVWDGALVGDLLECVLNGGTVVWNCCQYTGCII